MVLAKGRLGRSLLDDEPSEPSTLLATSLCARRRCRLVAAVSLVVLLSLGGYRLAKLGKTRSLGGKQSGAKLSLETPPAPPSYLRGWERERWGNCTTDFQACPMSKLDSPHNGCVSSDEFGKFLLTADGLSSPPVRRAFQAILESMSTVDNHGMSDKPRGRRVLLVLDGAYDAFARGSWHDFGAGGYCKMRQKELSSLGATAVVCVILDREVRAQLQEDQAEIQDNEAFVKAMTEVNDDMILDELDRAAAVFVDAGSPLILLQNFKRSLELKNAKRLRARMTLEGIVRAKIRAGSLAFFGVSSGASIAGEFMTEVSSSDVAQLGFDNSGLGLVPNCSFYPHAGNSDDDANTINDLAAAYSSAVMGLPNCQPIVNTGSSTGHLKHLCPDQGDAASA